MSRLIYVLTSGFAFVAYPAEYRNSGVMAFIVNQDGVVHQQDLGPKTSELGAAMQEYNPDCTGSEPTAPVRQPKAGMEAWARQPSRHRSEEPACFGFVESRPI
jgi:hypothetical protein